MESKPLHLESIRSEMGELANFLSNSGAISVPSSSDSEKVLQDCVLALETKVNQIVSEHADVGSFKDEDLDAFMNRLTIELRVMEAESASVSKEIEGLTKSYVEGACKLEHNLESLRHTVDCFESKVSFRISLRMTLDCSFLDSGTSCFALVLPMLQVGLDQEKARGHVDNYTQGEGHPKLHDNGYFETMDLKHKIEKNEMTLKSLQDLDLNLKRLDTIEKIEEALTGMKVIDLEDNCIRVSLKTYIPYYDGFMCQLNPENIVKLSEVKHELLIEVMDGVMELKNVEIFPNDVYIGDIVEAANTFSKLFSMLSVPETRSSLGWFLQKVQDRIVICTMRQFMAKNANESRHSFEYLDKDELIVAHMIGGIDAFIKPSQGWPLSTSALKLVSLKSSDQNAKEISLSLLCKVEEVANSLDFNVRRSITNFVDGIEEILLENMRPELQQ